ncbi:hypothetical protein INR49_016776 [Caranx melampygus]|nr:hypothetical protein INR49_016776 [Caranx melampygus]
MVESSLTAARRMSRVSLDTGIYGVEKKLIVIRHSGSKFGETHNGVVRGLQVGERLAQEVLQSGHIGQGEVVGRCERLSSSKSQAEEEAAEQPCGHRAGKKYGGRCDPTRRDGDEFPLLPLLNSCKALPSRRNWWRSGLGLSSGRIHKARTGLLSGKQTDPVERTATAGFITLSVAPYGYTNLQKEEHQDQERDLERDTECLAGDLES